jgi:virginiamycin B lyase
VAIAAGPDGSMWFTDEGVKPAIGRATPGGSVREFSRGLLAGSQPADITLGPDGRMWFTDEGATTALGTVTVEAGCSGSCRAMQLGAHVTLG